MASLTKLTAAPVSSSIVTGVPLISTGTLKLSGTDCDTECTWTIAAGDCSHVNELGSFDFSSEILCTDWLLSGFCLLFPGFDFLKDPLLLQALAICPTF